MTKRFINKDLLVQELLFSLCDGWGKVRIFAGRNADVLSRKLNFWVHNLEESRECEYNFTKACFQVVNPESSVEYTAFKYEHCQENKV